MSSTQTLDTRDSVEGASEEDAQERVAALLVAWAGSEPDHVGEVVLIPPGPPLVFGRGDAEGDDDERATLVRQRPGQNERAASLKSPLLSRRQLRLEAQDGGILVENLGKRPLLVDDYTTPRVHLKPGQAVELRRELVLYCVERPRRLPALRHLARAPRTFGVADDCGFVGESPVAWSLRDQIAFFAGRSAHVLLTGESGVGKEVVAQAIHASSARRGKKLIARNAATFPSGLIDAELFGNVAGYPSQGMPERPGLIGAADGSTLFLDEIGELAVDLQSHLLRVLDAHGEYQRLGEARPRTADIRLVAATNRSLHEMKHDLVARLGLRMEVPGLNARLDDVPLIARHLLRRTMAEDAALARRFADPQGDARTSPALVRALLGHRYKTHVRELESLLWRSIEESPGAVVELTAGVVGALQPNPEVAPKPVHGPEIGPEAIRASMARHGGVQERVWRELGLANRYVLKRLLKKYGLRGSDDDGDAD